MKRNIIGAAEEIKKKGRLMGPRIETSYGLNQAQLADIQQLETACNQFEALSTKLNWITLQDRPVDQGNDFLCYADGQLVGYLALYSFNQSEAEVSAMTHPAYRRRGIFRQLLAAASAEVRARGIPALLFICERTSTAGVACMQAIAAQYEFSEYKMQWQEPFTPDNVASELQLRPARPEDMAVLVRMEETCFGIAAEVAQRWLVHDIADPHRKVLLASLGPVKIGKISIMANGVETYISAFCIWPEYRRRGYGKIILARTLEQLLAERHPNIVLEVACDNAHALALYEQCGFRPVTIYDYYRLPVLLS
jgi:ribosomal protein S18 acetylase RimI-like enzyme